MAMVRYALLRPLKPDLDEQANLLSCQTLDLILSMIMAILSFKNIMAILVFKFVKISTLSANSLQ
jgi:hypothetical protein